MLEERCEDGQAVREKKDSGRDAEAESASSQQGFRERERERGTDRHRQTDKLRQTDRERERASSHIHPPSPGDERARQRESSAGETGKEASSGHQKDGKEWTDGGSEDHGQGSRADAEFCEEVYSDESQHTGHCTEGTDSQVSGCHG